MVKVETRQREEAPLEEIEKKKKHSGNNRYATTRQKC